MNADWHHHIFVETLQIAAVAWLVWLLLLTLTIVVKKTDTAAFTAMFSIFAGLAGSALVLAAFTAPSRGGDWSTFMLIAVPAAGLTVLPLWVLWQKQDREVEAKMRAVEAEAKAQRDARADHAERVIRSFGA